ncbi:MAG: prenyltransferase/squalene oxidase repeat-containing protein, partial [Pirellulales bacterium]
DSLAVVPEPPLEIGLPDPDGPPLADRPQITRAPLPAEVLVAATLPTTVGGSMVPAVPAPVVPQGTISGGRPGLPAAAFAGRRGEARSRGGLERGGSAASEAAVERGLEWLVRHQAADGSWRFDLSGCRCDGGCRHPGTVPSTTAATGIALLPFLGAGHTHVEGVHRETVTRGLYYLMSRVRPSARGGDLSEGTMYGHGVATLALAEALGMSGDRMLVPYVRDAVRFIETSQDMHGGGWRYLPGQAGDTTVTAWQITALKSAALAGVVVPSPTIDAAGRFLDRVQVRQGEGYGYLAPQDRSCTSAIGLLCRIYTNWPQEATLDRGLARLAKPGPAGEAVYQNFYLSQALLLRNHPAWRRWNARNRDQLVARQSQIGHETGSWNFSDPDTAPGGRLGHTALAILTLEVYYRLLPIYGEDAAQSGW